MEYRTVLGIVAIVVGLCGYATYFRGIVRGTTKPHAFSWLIWGTMQTITFIAQLTKGGGSGAWVTGVSAAIALVIAVISARHAKAYVHAFDWAALVGSALGIIAWMITRQPLAAVIFVTVAAAFGYVPTIRKAYERPNEDAAIQFGLSAAKWIIALPALVSFNLTTVLYPASIICMDSAVVLIVLMRRRSLARRA